MALHYGGTHGGGSTIYLAMRDQQRYRTLGRESHRFGRISVTFDVQNKKLFVSVASAQGIFQSKAEETNLSVVCRIQILSSSDPSMVVDSLFSGNAPRSGDRYKKQTHKHRSTHNPKFDQVVTPSLARPINYLFIRSSRLTC